MRYFFQWPYFTVSLNLYFPISKIHRFFLQDSLFAKHATGFSFLSIYFWFGHQIFYEIRK